MSDDAFVAALREAHQAMEDEFNRVFNVEGWTLRDIPWMTQPLWDQFIDMVQEDNLKIGTMSTREDWEGGPFARGMVLISPQGMENIRAFNEANRNEA